MERNEEWWELEGENGEGSGREEALAQVTFPLPMTFIRRIFCLLLPGRHGFDMKGFEEFLFETTF